MTGAGAGREILRGFLLPASRAAVCAARIRSRKRTSAASSAVRERRGRDTPPATPPGPSCGGGGGAAEARAHSRHAATREMRAAVILQLCIRSTFSLEQRSMAEELEEKANNRNRIKLTLTLSQLNYLTVNLPRNRKLKANV